MEKEKFLLKDKLKKINLSFVENGWLTLYEHKHTDDDQSLVYCCLVDENKFKTYKQDRDWGISPGSEGKPSIIGWSQKGKWEYTYQTYSDEGIEPFIFSKYFHANDIDEHYIDISEEFILYFKLYEKIQNKQNRSFCFFDEIGDIDEVINIKDNCVKIKLKYLMEYISIRKMFFIICFDFMRLSTKSFAEIDVESIDQDYISEKYCYNHLIRHIPGMKEIQSWLHGKTFIAYDKNKTQCFYFDSHEYEKYLVGYNDDGSERYLDCSKTNEKYFVLTYFKKEVLDKYYNNPSRYEVDGFHVKSKFFSLKIDNNCEDYVAVFLVELSSLPYKEQLHWKQYNIPPQGGMSNTYYKTMIEGNWSEHPETADLFFKDKYNDFNKKWETKFGWKFYKPLNDKDEYHFQSLHIPTANNEKDFYEQILSLAKITIDSLNEEEIGKGIILDPKDKGIAKLDKFLTKNNTPIPDMIVFLKHLYNLRSGISAHRFSNSNKKVKQAIDYFRIRDNNLIEVANDIFIKSIYTMNTLEKHFLST